MKRKLAILMSFLMLLTMIPMQAFADDKGLLAGDEKAKIELVYMKYNDGVTESGGKLNGTSGDGLQCHPETPANLAVGDKFLLGVKISDIANIKAVADGNGMNSIIATVLYDSTYVTAEAKTSISRYSPLRLNTDGAQAGDLF